MSAFFSFIIANSQNRITQKYIDSIIDNGDSLTLQTYFYKGLLLYKKANQFSNNINYKNGIIRSDFKIARNLNSLGKYKETFDQIKIIEKKHHNFISKNPEFEYKLRDLVGSNYLSYHFKREASTEFKKMLPIAEKFKDENVKVDKKLYIYQCIASCYEFVENDSAYHYLYKASYILKSKKLFDNTSIPSVFHHNTLFVYKNLADYQMYFSKNLDSATYYNTKAVELGQVVKSGYVYLFYLQKAQILNASKEYASSLDYCFKSLKNTNENVDKEDLIKLYKLISENYKSLKNREKHFFYMNKYISLNDSLSTIKKEGIIVSSDYLSSKQRENVLKQKKVRENYFLVGITVIILISLVSILMIIGYRKRQKELHLRLQQKKQKLLEKELEKVQLEKKINDSFDEVLQLAKANSSSFFARFQEIYPFFTPQLLNVESKLQSSELTFCAYIFLNFSTKEIAAYTFTSVKTVQNRKNHIRKKLLIPSDKDIYVWMKETITS
ncbi:hypothetical protein IO90_12570 [Chryseobacterium sp. FH1]|nr:hypothetical protein IO90_12570 [Chryseobacterium sp. FH1]